MTMVQLSELWLKAKADETEAQARRRAIETQMAEALEIEDCFEGSKAEHAGAHKIKITRRMTRKVDGDALQDIATKHGLNDHLSVLFRWKPEINAKTWGKAAPEITSILSGAITTTPGKPSFKIEKEDDA